MKTLHISAPRWFLPASAILFLTACASGGGPAPAPVPAPAPPPQIPLYTAPASDLGGSSTSYAIDTGASPQQLVQQSFEIEGTLTANTSGLQSITLRLLDGTTTIFVQEFTIADFQSGTVPPDWLAIGADKGLTFLHAQKTDGSAMRKLTLLDPENSAALDLQYSTLGIWESADPARTAQEILGGAFSLGVLTAGNDIPPTGTASYAGRLVGTYSDAGQRFSVGADAAATADFSARTVGLTTANSVVVPQGGGARTLNPDLDIVQGTFVYGAGTNPNSLDTTGGTPVQTRNGMVGRGLAFFYGPQAAELGGTVFVENAGAQRQMTGGFALKKQ